MKFFENPFKNKIKSALIRANAAHASISQAGGVPICLVPRFFPPKIGSGWPNTNPKVTMSVWSPSKMVFDDVYGMGKHEIDICVLMTWEGDIRDLRPQINLPRHIWFNPRNIDFLTPYTTPSPYVGALYRPINCYIRLCNPLYTAKTGFRVPKNM